MKILAFDPASTTGWSLINDNKLEQYGTIITSSKMKIGERLNFIADNVDKILLQTKPDIVGIEDTLLGISGVKTLSLLARINGIIIQRCYLKVQNNLYIINVKNWKKQCNLFGVTGNSKKWQVLFSVVRKFNLLTVDQINYFNNIIEKEINVQLNMKKKIQDKRTELEKLRRKGKREKIDTIVEEKKLKVVIDSNKKYMKNVEKESIKTWRKISKEITSITNISEDIADSIGIALSLSTLHSGT